MNRQQPKISTLSALGQLTAWTPILAMVLLIATSAVEAQSESNARPPRQVLHVGPTRDVHDAHKGHLVKTRAAHSSVFNNRILEGEGDSSYLLDLADGGTAEVFGDRFQQGPAAENRTAISFATEAKDKEQGHALSVSDNHFVNQGSPGTFVRNHSTAEAALRGNVLEGDITPLRGPGAVQG